LAESCFAQEDAGLGARLELPGDLRADLLLFSESPSRMVVSTPAGRGFEALAARLGVPCARIGSVGGDRLTLAAGGKTLVDLPVSRLLEAWTSLERKLSG
jgi:phosphoribosylformylglycinamidine synthase